jgi:pyridoxamine 5'-phosphate oxidase
VSSNPDHESRRDFSGLNASDLHLNPVKQFERWFQQALAANLPEPTAMTLATCTKQGIPSARIVLLKGYDEQGFVFYTNYESQKGKELAENPFGALAFHWAALERQVRISGEVSKVSRAESEIYFQSRPIGSQLGAWASNQSAVIQNREELEERMRQLALVYQNKSVPLPPYWGGYRLFPHMIEFWQGQTNRLHDRFRYTHGEQNQWRIERLSP